MRLFAFLPGLFCCFVSSAGYSSVTFYTDSAAFDSVTSTTLVEDFESISPKNTPISSFESNGISYTGFAGIPFPNVLVSSPGYTNYGVPLTTSSVLTSNGDEDFLLEFSTPITAVGFETYLNDFGPAIVSVLGNGGATRLF